jgi:hypothetical protein
VVLRSFSLSSQKFFAGVLGCLSLIAIIIAVFFAHGGGLDGLSSSSAASLSRLTLGNFGEGE